MKTVNSLQRQTKPRRPLNHRDPPPLFFDMIIIRLQRKSYALVHDRYNLLRMVSCPFICLINSEPLSTFNHQKGNGINILMCARRGRPAPRHTPKWADAYLLLSLIRCAAQKKGKSGDEVASSYRFKWYWLLPPCWEKNCEGARSKGVRPRISSHRGAEFTARGLRARRYPSCRGWGVSAPLCPPTPTNPPCCPWHA